MNELLDLENCLITKLKEMNERKQIAIVEKEIFSNQECLILIDCFQKALNDYNFTLKLFKENAGVTKEKQKVLYQAKLAMDNHELIKNYNDLLSKINEPLYYLEFNLFSLFKGKKKC